MLEDEYILSFISLSAHIQPAEFYQLLFLSSSSVFIGSGFRAGAYKIPAQQQAHAVTIHFKRQSNSMDKILADNINEIIFIVNIIGGITTILSIGMDIFNRFSIHQQIIQAAATNANIAHKSTTILNWTKPLFWVSVVFFILSGVTVLFSSIDFYRFMSVATFSILFFISLFLKTINNAILKANHKLEKFIGEQNLKLAQTQIEIQNANAIISVQQESINKAKEFIDDNKDDIHLSSSMAKLFAYRNFR